VQSLCGLKQTGFAGCRSIQRVFGFGKLASELRSASPQGIPKTLAWLQR
jgi:hypothetical protein